jgi:hypothetical protein
MDDFGQGLRPSSSSGGTHHTITPILFDNTTFDFSSLDAPWDPVGGDFTLGNMYDGRVDLPETRITPATPAEVLRQPSFGAQPVAQDAFPTNDGGGESSADALVGRRTDEVNALLDEQFKAIDDIFNHLVTATGLPLQQVSHAYHKGQGRIHSAFNHWNTYGHYLKVNRKQELRRVDNIEVADSAQITPAIRAKCYKAFRAAFPDRWQEILETFEEMEMTMGGPQTVSQWTQDFGKVWRKVASMVCSILYLKTDVLTLLLDGQRCCQTWLRSGVYHMREGGQSRRITRVHTHNTRRGKCKPFLHSCILKSSLHTLSFGKHTAGLMKTQ